MAPDHVLVVGAEYLYLIQPPGIPTFTAGCTLVKLKFRCSAHCCRRNGANIFMPPENGVGIPSEGSMGCWYRRPIPACSGCVGYKRREGCIWSNRILISTGEVNPVCAIIYRICKVKAFGGVIRVFTGRADTTETPISHSPAITHPEPDLAISDRNIERVCNDTPVAGRCSAHPQIPVLRPRPGRNFLNVRIWVCATIAGERRVCRCLTPSYAQAAFKTIVQKNITGSIGSKINRVSTTNDRISGWPGDADRTFLCI